MNKTVKRVIAAVTASGLICGGIYGGLYAYRSSSKMPVNVYSVGEIAGNTYYYSDDFGYAKSGTVVADRIQSCFLSDTQNVKEVLVTTGQQVKAGEPLYTFDTTLSEIELEKLEIELAQDQLDLKHMQDNLILINRLRPSSPDDGGGYDYDDGNESIPEEPVDVVYDPEPTRRLLSGDGTLEDPYVFLWSFQDILDSSEIIYLFHGGVMPETPGNDGNDDGGEEEAEDEGGNEDAGSGQEDGGTGEEPAEDREPVMALLLRGFFPVSVWAEPVDDQETDFYFEDDDEPEFYIEDDEEDPVIMDDDTCSMIDVEELEEPAGSEEPVGIEDDDEETDPAIEPEAEDTDPVGEDDEDTDPVISPYEDEEFYNEPTQSTFEEMEEPEEELVDIFDEDEDEDIDIEPEDEFSGENENFDDDEAVSSPEIAEDAPEQDTPVQTVTPDEGTSGQDTGREEASGQENPDAAGGESPDGNGDEAADASEEGTSSEAEEIDQTLEEEIDALIPADPVEVEDEGDDMDVFVILEIHQNDNSEAPLILRLGLHMFRVSNKIYMKLYNPDQHEDEGGEDSIPDEYDDSDDDGFGGYGGGDYYDDGYSEDTSGSDETGRSDLEIQDDTIDMSASYTAEEIASMRESTERDIAEMSIKCRVAEIDLREKKAEVGDGTVRSKVDGVVKTVRDPEDAKNNGSAVVQVSGGGGYFISSTIGELDLPDLEIGQSVTVMDYETGEEMIGSIDSISEYPSSGDDYGWFEGNPNSSNYGCTIRMDEDVELREDAWVEVNYKTSREDTTEGFFIDAMFVRVDPSGNYVYVRNADGKLEKRVISTGISSSDAIQVLGGLKTSDYIAFPYGDDCGEGADTEISTLESFYEFA